MKSRFSVRLAASELASVHLRTAITFPDGLENTDVRWHDIDLLVRMEGFDNHVVAGKFSAFHMGEIGIENLDAATTLCKDAHAIADRLFTRTGAPRVAILRKFGTTDEPFGWMHVPEFSMHPDYANMGIEMVALWHLAHLWTDPLLTFGTLSDWDIRVYRSALNVQVLCDHPAQDGRVICGIHTQYVVPPFTVLKHAVCTA